MDGRRFDVLTVTLTAVGGGSSRRAALRVLAGGALGTVLTRLGVQEAAAACRRDSDCSNRAKCCRAGRRQGVCVPADSVCCGSEDATRYCRPTAGVAVVCCPKDCKKNCCPATHPVCCKAGLVRGCCAESHPVCCPPHEALPEFPQGYCCPQGQKCCPSGCCLDETCWEKCTETTCCPRKAPNCCAAAEGGGCCWPEVPVCCPPHEDLPEYPTGYCCPTGYECDAAVSGGCRWTGVGITSAAGSRGQTARLRRAAPSAPYTGK